MRAELLHCRPLPWRWAAADCASPYCTVQHWPLECWSRGICFMRLSRIWTTSSKLGLLSGLGSQHLVTIFFSVCTDGYTSESHAACPNSTGSLCLLHMFPVAGHARLQISEGQLLKTWVREKPARGTLPAGQVSNDWAGLASMHHCLLLLVPVRPLLQS